MWITVVVTVTRTHTSAHTTPTEPQTFICKSYKADLMAATVSDNISSRLHPVGRFTAANLPKARICAFA